MDLGNICYLFVLICAMVVAGHGLKCILKNDHEHEQLEKISIQIRGFGLLFVAQAIYIIGSALCFGVDNGFKAIPRALMHLA